MLIRKIYGPLSAKRNILARETREILLIRIAATRLVLCSEVSLYRLSKAFEQLVL
jgi:hypothetical protein